MNDIYTKPANFATEFAFYAAHGCALFPIPRESKSPVGIVKSFATVVEGPRTVGPLASTVSTRALNVASRSFFRGLLHQYGTSPQRISSRLRPPSVGNTTSTGSVGQTLYRG
jgi:hypothetical protein